MFSMLPPSAENPPREQDREEEEADDAANYGADDRGRVCFARGGGFRNRGGGGNGHVGVDGISGRNCGRVGV